MPGGKKGARRAGGMLPVRRRNEEDRRQKPAVLVICAPFGAEQLPGGLSGKFYQTDAAEAGAGGSGSLCRG